MISLTKIIDPLSGYIAKVQKDASDRQRDRKETTPELSGAGKLVSAEEATQAAYVNRLTAEINEMRSGIKNMRDGLEALETAEAAYEDVLSVLDKMYEKLSGAQAAEDLNKALSSDSVALGTALTSYSNEITAIIGNRTLNEQTLIDGTFTNKTFPTWSSQISPPSISIENIEDTMSTYRTFSALALAGDLNANINTNNIAGSKTITIEASNGTNRLDQLVGESASSLASRINLLEATNSTAIGVTAYARSTVRLNDLTNAGTISLSLAGEKQGMNPQNIGSVVISDKTDLGPLAAAINRYSEATGVFASMGSTNNDIVLTDPTGGNIGISSFTHSVSNTTLSVSVDRRDGLTDFSLDGETANYNGVSTGFANGSITFGHVGNLTSENINLATVTPGNANAAGAVSIDASKNIFIGNGSSRFQVGSANASNDGVGGNTLQIDFSSNSRVFANSTFSSDSNWTKNASQIVSGTTLVDSIRTRTDNTFPNQQGASGTFTINGGSDGDIISAVTINGVNLLGGSVPYSTDNETTAGLVRNAINSNSSSPNYTATVDGAVVTISAAENTGYTPNSYSISHTATGSISASGTSLSGGVNKDKESISSGSPFSTTIAGGEATLTVNNATTTNPTTVVKGPALVSDGSIFLLEKEQVSFSWSGTGQNSDHFDIQAYLVNTANNNGNNARTVTMLNTTAASGSGTATGTVGTTGNYKLVIVSGAFDNDGDRDSSSTVTIDNVSVSAITDDVLDVIKNNITYENLNFAASSASYTPQVSITSVTGGGSSTSESINVPATLAGFSLTGGSNEEVISTGEVTILSSNSFSLSQQDNNTNGTTFWESSAGTIETLQLLSGSNPVTSDSALRIQNAAERVSLAIKNVTDAKEKGLVAYRSQFEFGEFDTSNYLDSLNTTKAEAIEPVVAQNMTQKTAKMIIADEIQGLLAKMGNASADDVYALLRST